MAALKARYVETDFKIGTREEMKFLRTETEKMEMYSKEIRKVVQVKI